MSDQQVNVFRLAQLQEELGQRPQKLPGQKYVPNVS